MINFKVKVNNQDVDNGAVRIINGRPVISWSFDEIDTSILDEYGLVTSSSIIDQATFHILIGTNPGNLGKGLFAGNTRNTGIIESPSKSWAYFGPALTRGTTYYGQVIVVDDAGHSSGWVTFSFTFNMQPSVTGVELLPTLPNANDDLTLSYIFEDGDGDSESGTRVQWFRNSVHHRQHDNEISIGSEFLVYGETWQAHVFPSDGYEFGARTLSGVATVTTNVPVSSDVQILPRFPNPNDILKADYKLVSDLIQDKSKIRWYVNGVVQSEKDDQQFARLTLSPSDKVRFEVQPFDGVRYGDIVASESVTISDAEFLVENIKIEGQVNPLDLLSLRPIVSWTVCAPNGKVAKHISIRIGTSPGGNNVFSTTLKSTQTSFQVPDNELQRGTDYFFSISVSDTTTFDRYTISHFRTSGSRWESFASNVVGWTVELVFNVNIEDDTTFDGGKYQFVRIQDGTKFGEVRIYSDRLGFISTGLVTFTASTFDLGRFRVLTIVGKDNDIEIYLDRKSVLNLEGQFMQTTTAKKLEFGSTTGDLTARYQSIYYTTNGNFYPGVSDEFSTLQFHQYASFPFHEAVGLKGFVEDNVNKKVFAINPNDADEGGSVFTISPGSPVRLGTAARSLAPISSACTSLNSLYKVFGHARGAAIMKSYLINQYDHFIDFTATGSNVDPTANGWELVQNFGKSGAKQQKGWVINTIAGS